MRRLYYLMILVPLLFLFCKQERKEPVLPKSDSQISERDTSNLLIGWYQTDYDDVYNNSPNNFIIFNRFSGQKLKIFKASQTLGIALFDTSTEARSDRKLSNLIKMNNDRYRFIDDKLDIKAREYFKPVNENAFSDFRSFLNRSEGGGDYEPDLKQAIAQLHLRDTSICEIKRILIDSVATKYLYIYSAADLFLVTSGKTRNVQASTYSLSKLRPMFDLRLYDKDPVSNIIVSKERLKKLSFHFAKYVLIEDCQVSDTAEILCDRLDTLSMDYLSFKNSNSVINLETSGKSKTIIYLRYIDASKINFDYTHFRYQPPPLSNYDSNFNAWFSDITNCYKGIISSQRKRNNQQGIRDASIELGIFKDKQLLFGEFIVKLKIWWNNYGYDRENVIIASTELFIFFMLLNSLIFKRLLQVYPLSNIVSARDYSFEIINPILRIGFQFLLCGLYTGFLFYGLKFDFGNLKIKSIALALWILFQYVIGIVSIAYIANLVLSKS